jgi:LacI family transcriptional regulator
MANPNCPSGLGSFAWPLTLASENRFAVIFCNVDHRVEKQRHYLDVLMQKRVDGIIDVGGDYNYRESQAALESMDMNLVLIGRHDDLDYPTVENPDVESGSMATRHLIEFRHRRIAFIAGPSSSLAARDRLDGVRGALAAAGTVMDESLVREGNYDEKTGYDIGWELLLLEQPPSAIVAANDRMAIGVLAAASDLGVAVPDFVSVIGFGNIATSLYSRPALTTVATPLHFAGREAMRIMLGILGGESVPRRTVMPSSLVVRASTALARG